MTSGALLRLNLYDKPPLFLFQQDAINKACVQRLKALTDLDHHMKHMPMITFHDNINDWVSHFYLRLFFAESSFKMNWFVEKEMALFRKRVKLGHGFSRLVNPIEVTVSDLCKRFYNNGRFGNIYLALDFEYFVGLKNMTEVFLDDGKVLIPQKLYELYDIELNVQQFGRDLKKNIILTAKKFDFKTLENREVQCLINDAIRNPKPTMPLPNNAIDFECFPPCMKLHYENLVQKKLKFNNGRPQFVTFLLKIGMKKEDIKNLWIQNYGLEIATKKNYITDIEDIAKKNLEPYGCAKTHNCKFVDLPDISERKKACMRTIALDHIPFFNSVKYYERSYKNNCQ